MSKHDTPTIERTKPERARQISQDACRGQDYIRMPPALATSLALALLAVILIVIGMVRP